MFLRCFCVFCVIFINNVFAFDARTDNLASCKDALLEYIHSGSYINDLNKKADYALNYLKKEYSKNDFSNLAIVFDIDETLLSNTKSLEKYHFGGDKVVFNEITKAADADPIHSVINIYNWAKQHHVAVYLVTGRSELFKKETVLNLQKAGVNGWDGLYFWPHDSNLSVQRFKANMRDELQKEGKLIILNIGDQHSDLIGGNARKSIKLPNPFYLIPSNKKRA